jgi:deoxyribonuclease V
MITEPLIACLDVDYRDTGAMAAGLWFRGWSASAPVFQAVAHYQQVQEYEPGAFYRRELPCLLGVLAQGARPDVVVVDGYVWLGNGQPGLGAHLHTVYGGVVVGVAKTRYASATDALEVRRGNRQSPLFVSAVGMTAEKAAAHIRDMQGPYRVPTLLKLVDTLARTSPACISTSDL